MAEPTIEQAQQGVHRMADDMGRSHKEAKGLFDSLAALSSTILPGFLQIREFFNGTSVGRGISQAYQALGKTVQQLQDQREGEFLALDRRRRDGEISEAMYQRQLLALNEQAVVFDHQLTVSREANRLGTVRLTLAKLLVVEAGRLWYLSRQLNQNLIEADSSASNRFKLMYDTLGVMRQTGASFEQATRISAALVRYGFDTKKNYQDVAARIQMMNEGLGMSVDLSAQLATLVQTRMAASFDSVGDTIATLVNATTLCADEAGRLAINLGRVMATMGPGIDSTALPAVTKLVGQYESALKELGGQVGTVEQFLAHMTTSAGMTGAGALGISNPEFLATEKGTEAVLTRFAAYANQFIGQASGWDRRMRLESLAQQFNISAENAQLLLETIEKRKTQDIDNIALEERYRQQLHATNDAIGRVYNALTSLVHGALYPVIWAVSKGLSIIADILQFIVKNEPIAYAAMGGLGIGIGYLILATGRLVMAFRATAVGAYIAAQAERALAIARGTGTAASGGAAASGFFSLAMPTLGRYLSRGFSMLLGPVGIIAIAAAGIWMMLERWKKEWASVEQKARLGAATVAMNLKDSYRSMVALTSREGDQERMAQVMARLGVDLPKMIPGYAEMGTSDKLKSRESVLQDFMQTAELSEQARRLFYTKIGDKEKAADAVSQDLQRKILDTSKEQTKIVVEEWKEQQRGTEAQKESNRRALLRSQPQTFTPAFMGY